MVKPETIQYLKRDQIDATRWDACLQSVTNASPYGLSEYLDAMCPEWEALVEGDYKSVMPLPIRSKWGIRYLYQPFLVPHLGIFGTDIDSPLTERFIQSIPADIRWIDITLNPENTRARGIVPITERTNFVLKLNDSYKEIRDRYRENHIRNLLRASKAGLTIERNIDPARIFALAEQYLRPRGHFAAENKVAFLTLMNQWMNKGLACTYAIVSGNQLMASALFLTYRSRAYYLLVGNHPNGKTLGASHLLIDTFIQEHVGKDWILDFEGSDVPSLAYFYEGFGSEKEVYGQLHIDRLPGWISWIKSRLSFL